MKGLCNFNWLDSIAPRKLRALGLPMHNLEFNRTPCMSRRSEAFEWSSTRRDMQGAGQRRR